MNKPNIIGPKLGYIDMLEIKTQEFNDAEAAAPVTRAPLRPSAAGHCARELAYMQAEYKGKASYPKEPITPELTRIFAFGHSAEYMMVNQFKMNCKDLIQLKYAQQSLFFFNLPDGSRLEGSLDAVFYSKEHKCIVDFKSKKDKFSNHYSSNWDETSEKLRKLSSVQSLTDTTFYVDDLAEFIYEMDDPFLASNFYQLNFYALNPFIVEAGIDHAAIIQLNKNDCRLREIRFKPSQAVYDYVKDKFLAVAQVIEEGKGPESVEKEFVLGSIKCAFCNYKRECWPKNDATKDFWRSMPDKKWPKDLSKMGETGLEIAEALGEFVVAKSSEPVAKKAEAKVLKLMQSAGVAKIRLTNGDVYEIKELKDSIQLRRSKV